MQDKAIFNKKEIFHIVVWMPSWIGDVVLALPALQALRDIYPKTRITVITKFPTGQLLSNHKAVVDTVLKFPKNMIHLNYFLFIMISVQIYMTLIKMILYMNVMIS